MAVWANTQTLLARVRYMRGNICFMMIGGKLASKKLESGKVVFNG